MLSAIRIRGFKAFKDSGAIEFKPLTVLAGTNSSGKSTILQALLLLKQSAGLSAADARDELILDGRYVQTDSLSTLAFGQPPINQARVGFDLAIETKIPFDAARRYFPQLQGHEGSGDHLLSSDLTLDFASRPTPGGHRRVEAVTFSLRSSIHDMEGPRLSVDRVAGRFIPRMTGSGLDRPKLEGRKFVGIVGLGFIPSHYLVEPVGRRAGGPPEIQPIQQIFSVPLGALRAELDNRVHYLGPLREQPRRAYLHTGSGRADIGDRGEYAAQVLWLERDRIVEYGAEGPGGGSPARAPLLKAVNEAFRAMGLDQPIEVKSIRSVLYQIQLGLRNEPGKSAAISEVGFGVSQLLPIVLLALRSDPGDLLLLEQPEIHLHPRLQANLADFLLALASTGRRVVVETHSDHFINRLRRRVAEAPTDNVRELVSILFVRPGQGADGAQVESLRVDPFGNVENWPPDFLPEGSLEAEAILRAGLKKRVGVSPS